MKADDYQLLQRVNGVQVTVCENRFEVVIEEETDAKEQHLMGMLRDWVRSRREKKGFRLGGLKIDEQA